MNNNSALPPIVTRNYDTEKMIKYESLSPSLQARILDLEDRARDLVQGYLNTHTDTRITFGEFPPFKPQESKELWIDTKYRALRVFAEGNWEFTRAAWHKGSSTESPPITEPDIPVINIPGPSLVDRSIVLATCNNGSVIYDSQCSQGNINFYGENPRITVRGSGGAVSGYVFISVYSNYRCSGSIYSIPVNTLPFTIPTSVFGDKHSIAVEFDVKGHASGEVICPINFDPAIDLSKFSNCIYLTPAQFPFTLSYATVMAALNVGRYPVVASSYPYNCGYIEVQLDYKEYVW